MPEPYSVNTGIQLKQPSSQAIPIFKTHNLNGFHVPPLATCDDDIRESFVIVAYGLLRPPLIKEDPLPQEMARHPG
jgi:hypothetical protein